jgi:MYND finger
MDSTETHHCNKCGNQAELRCGRCRAAWYCNRDCQKADHKDHKTLCRSLSPDTPDLLPPGFVPQRHLRCMGCGQVAMVCPCEGVTSGQGLVFVMPPIPSGLTFRQRISRWALLVKLHPLLSVFDAVRYVQDRPPELDSDMEFIKPIIVRHMEQYKSRSFDSLADKLQIPAERRFAFVEKTKEDADYAVGHFFAGNWGYISIFEYSLLYNSFQESGPEDHDDAAYPRFLSVWNELNTILDVFKSAGIRDKNYRLEDLENIVYSQETWRRHTYGSRK